MSKIVILGIEGEQDLWVADLGAGTITKIATAPTGKLKVIDDMRKAGATITQGINLAATAKTVDGGSSGLREVSGGILDISGGILDVSSGILDG
jgi:hypothetical protein